MNGFHIDATLAGGSHHAHKIVQQYDDPREESAAINQAAETA